MEQILPVLPLRDIVVFPYMIVPLFVGREKSIKALENIMTEDKQILLVAQKNSSDNDPTTDEIFKIGTIATILQLLKLPDGTVKVLVEGTKRAKVTSYTEQSSFYEAMVEVIEENSENESEIEALSRSVVNQFDHYVKLNKKVAAEVLLAINQIEEPSKLADTVASHVALKIHDKQELLSIFDVSKRLERIYSFMEGEIDVLQVEKKIRGRVKRQMEKTQREYYLNEQMKAIQKELGETEDGRDEISELEDKIKKTKLTKEAKEKSLGEIKKLKSMSPVSAEAAVVRNFLDWILSVPWNKRSRLKKDIRQAEKVLDLEHYGLDKVKERIIEYLAVQQRTRKIKGAILCLVGPPGVGKTSLGQSIANATGRKFVRFSLGGVRDESEIRGHRRTYIGSMPGKIIQSMKKANSSNPLFLLDEIDKMGQDFRGDPASALLEVLDPEQNSNFNDHYLEVDYDLSDVMFVTTANTMDMPRALLDRMEIIHLSGYTETEKVEIAKRHLISKSMKDHGLISKEWSITDSALLDLIRYYTKESGVRGLERSLNNLHRKAVKKIVQKEAKVINITSQNLNKFAGIKKHRFGEVNSKNQVGVVTGLAWTEVGGELLSIESVVVTGKGRIKTTGKLGEVMTESIEAAKSFVHSKAPSYGIRPDTFHKRDIHIHVPEGATPKDGPSAGVAMVTSIVSGLTGIPVHRDVAMTGEVTLRGNVLPIGGLKEKLLAALRGGIKTVLIPKDNEKDLEEIPDNIKSDLTIIPISMVDEVLNYALIRKLKPIEWDDEKEALAALKDKKPEGKTRIITTH